MDNNNNRRLDLETPALTVLAAASKTPFKTAFLATLGIGLGRLVLFFTFVLGAIAIYKIFN